MPAFNGHALRGYEDLVTGLAKAEVATLARGRAVRVAGADERADPRGDPAGRLRRHRRVAARGAAAAGEQDRRIIPPMLLGWGFPRLQRFGPWRRTVENQVELDRVIFAEIARASRGRRPGRRHRRTLPAAARP